MSISVVNCPRNVQTGGHDCDLCDSGTMPVDVVETFLGFLVTNDRKVWAKLTEIFQAETGLILDIHEDKEHIDRCVEQYKARFWTPEERGEPRTSSGGPTGPAGPKPDWAA